MALNAPAATRDDRAEVAGSGQCASCHYLQVLRSRTSTFVRCRRADLDDAFERYPPLPVLECRGYTPELRRPPATIDA